MPRGSVVSAPERRFLCESVKENGTDNGGRWKVSFQPLRSLVFGLRKCVNGIGGAVQVPTAKIRALIAFNAKSV